MCLAQIFKRVPKVKDTKPANDIYKMRGCIPWQLNNKSAILLAFT